MHQAQAVQERRVEDRAREIARLEACCKVVAIRRRDALEGDNGWDSGPSQGKAEEVLRSVHVDDVGGHRIDDALTALYRFNRHNSVTPSPTYTSDPSSLR